ncbi:hypothetical protein Ssi03_58090 [Sphaerisporangium siamense]|nr:hypothetical protein Ssi03_58090 [Sphaerisporangium siamense]
MSAPGNRQSGALDALVELRSDDGTYAELLTDLRSDVSPRTVEEIVLPKFALVRQVSAFTHVLVMAPWISPRTQGMLREHGVNYLDLTGNISLRVPRPAVAIYTQGRTRAPRGAAVPRAKATLAGPKAGRLVRLLVDAAPPYRAGELAEAAGLSLPYVSRLLDALEDHLLIRRDGRVITDVDWPGLLRARAETLNLLRQNRYVGMLAPNGTAQVWAALRDLQGSWPRERRLVVTGSHAARLVAPVAVGGQLMLYLPAAVPDAETLGDILGLLPVAEGADVLLLEPRDEVVFERTRVIDDLPQVALSQLVLDCLSGPGRMPAEGEAVLRHMLEHQQLWRASGIPALGKNMSP